MSTEKNKAIVRRLYEEGYGKGNLSVFDEVFAPVIIERTHALKVFEQKYTPEDYKKTRVAVAAAFDDFHLETNELIAEGDKVVAMHTMTGTHKRKLWDFEPTNKKGRITQTIIYRIVDGKIAEASLPSGWLRYWISLLNGTLFKEQEES